MTERTGARPLGREETSVEEMPGRTRRRTQLRSGTESTTRGRRLFESLQKNRQGTERRSGAHEPQPRIEEQEAYQPSEALPSERGASRRKRIAWSLGALTAFGGAGAFAFYRRRQRARRERRDNW